MIPRRSWCASASVLATIVAACLSLPGCKTAKPEPDLAPAPADDAALIDPLGEAGGGDAASRGDHAGGGGGDRGDGGGGVGRPHGAPEREVARADRPDSDHTERAREPAAPAPPRPHDTPAEPEVVAPRHPPDEDADAPMGHPGATHERPGSIAAPLPDSPTGARTDDGSDRGRTVALATPAAGAGGERAAREPIGLDRGSLSPTGATAGGVDARSPRPLSALDGADGKGRSTDAPNGVVRLPAGLVGASAAAPRTAPQSPASPAASIVASAAPAPVDRVSAIKLIGGSERESFVIGIDGASPRLLSRAEALGALEAAGDVRIVVMPISDEDAESLGRWIEDGRPVGGSAWLAGLAQSEAARAERERRREAELDHVRAQRQKLRDALYRRLAGDDAPATPE